MPCTRICVTPNTHLLFEQNSSPGLETLLISSWSCKSTIFRILNLYSTLFVSNPQTCVSLVSLIHHLMVRNISGISSHKLLNFSCSSGRVPEAVQLLHTACPKHGANSSDRWKPWCVNTSNSLASFKLCANWKLPHAFVSWRGRRVSVNKPSALAENIGSLGIAAHRYRRVGVAWPAEKLGRAGYMGGHRRPMKSDCFLLISAIRQPVEMLQFLCVLLRNWGA